jgi:hypothetical protein
MQLFACHTWVAIPFAFALLTGCDGGGGASGSAGRDGAVAQDTGGAPIDTGGPNVPDTGLQAMDLGALPEDASASPDVARPPPLDWGECPEFFSAECAYVDLPLDWNEPDGRTISVLVARRPAADPNAPQL